MTEAESNSSARTSQQSYRGRRRLVCGYCDLPVTAGTGQQALVPDSSAIHSDDPGLDGRRVVNACGREHLERLIERARAAWVDEQWWFGRLIRVSVKPAMRGASVELLAVDARLTPENLRAALAWNARQARPDTAFPGGQRVPLASRGDS